MSVWLTASITESNVNTDANTSDVTVQLYANWDWGSYNLLNPPGTCTIDGTTYNFNHNFNSNRTSTGSELIYSGTKTVAHDADGSKTVSVSAWFNTQVSSGEIRWSGTKQLTTIARASQPSLGASSVVMGNGLYIYTNRQSSSFTHTLEWRFGNSAGTIATGVTTGTAWGVPLALANQIPNATSGKGTIICYTYNGSKLIGSKTVEFTATVPTSVVPMIQGFTAEETVSGLAAKFGAYVQTKSKVKFTAQAVAQYSATVARIATSFNGQSLVGAEVTSDIVMGSGTVNAVLQVKDSRGRTASQTKALTVLAYSPPSISNFSVFRATGTTADAEGTAVGVDMAFTISPCNNKNDRSYKVEYRIQGTEQWSTLVSGSTYTYANSTWFSSAGIFSVDYSYEFRLTVSDYFNSYEAFSQIDTGFSLIDYRNTGKGIAFGKASEKDAFECALDAEFTGAFSAGRINASSVYGDGGYFDTVGLPTDGTIPTHLRWANASLLNGWGNATNYERIRYMIDPFGFVHLQGRASGGTVTAGTGIMTLPQGFRPESNLRFQVPMGNDSAFMNGHIDIGYNGNVIIKFAAVTVTWIDLSGITFYARA